MVMGRRRIEETDFPTLVCDRLKEWGLSIRKQRVAQGILAMMMSTSEGIPQMLYVYLQRPDNGQWVVVGRYTQDRGEIGRFKYAPSYTESGARWTIDPVNPLPAQVRQR